MESDRDKAERFTADARVFMLSLSDALKACDQIAGIKSSRYFLGYHLNVLQKSERSKRMLLVKDCSHFICPRVNLIASKDVDCWLSYEMYRFSVRMNVLYSEALKKCKDFYELDKVLDDILVQSKNKLEENLFT